MAVVDVVLRLAVVAIARADAAVLHHDHDSRLGDEDDRGLDSVPPGSA